MFNKNVTALLIIIATLPRISYMVPHITLHSHTLAQRIHNAFCLNLSVRLHFILN